MCGTKGRRRPILDKEIADIEPLYRGAFASRDIKKGEKITEKDCFMAMPNSRGQLLAKQMSKYSEYYANADIAKNAALMLENLQFKDLRVRVRKIVNDLRALLKKRRIALPAYVDLEISHHHGLERLSLIHI